MKRISLTCVLFLIAVAVYSQQPEGLTIEVGGKKIAYKTFQLENRKEGDPILVFESGLGGGTFDPILPYLPDNIAGIQYDRPGIGQSDPDPGIATDSQLMERLHGLLEALDIKPPYLLVGHSIGGPYIRMFAAKFPDEVFGLVFSDPTDFLLTQEEDREAKNRSGSATSYREILPILMKNMYENEGFSSGTRSDALRAMKTGYFPEYGSLPPLKSSMAVTVIISYHKPIEQPDIAMNESLGLGINFKPWWKEYDNLRIQHYSDLIKDNDNSKIILLPKYSHGIYYQNPEMVANLIVENFNSQPRE